MSLMNRLSTSERARVVASLVEGNSIRATVRMLGFSKNTSAGTANTSANFSAIAASIGRLSFTTAETMALSTPRTTAKTLCVQPLASRSAFNSWPGVCACEGFTAENICHFDEIVKLTILLDKWT